MQRKSAPRWPVSTSRRANCGARHARSRRQQLRVPGAYHRAICGPAVLPAPGTVKRAAGLPFIRSSTSAQLSMARSRPGHDLPRRDNLPPRCPRPARTHARAKPASRCNVQRRPNGLPGHAVVGFPSQQGAFVSDGRAATRQRAKPKIARAIISAPRSLSIPPMPPKGSRAPI